MTLSHRAERAAPDEARGLLEELLLHQEASRGGDN